MFTHVLQLAGQVLLLFAAAPLAAGFIKKTKAKLQNRRGSSVLQVYFDLFKLLAKDSVLSPATSWVFCAAPYVVLMSAVAAAACLPLNLLFDHRELAFADLFLFVYLLGLGRFFLTLASLDAGSAFGGMGGSREMFIAVLVEPALLLSLLTVAVKPGSVQFASMAQVAAGYPFSVPYIFAAVAFLLVLLAEIGRIPVDNPDTHLELTMIHEAMILEYSGRYLGLLFWASALKQLVIILLFVTLFLPWNFGVQAGWLLWLLLLGKLILTLVALACIETGTNKMRLFKVPGFIAMSCFLSLLALVSQ